MRLFLLTQLACQEKMAFHAGHYGGVAVAYCRRAATRRAAPRQPIVNAALFESSRDDSRTGDGDTTMMLLLAADIGGTKANFGLFEQQGARCVMRREQTLVTTEYGSAGAAVRAFLGPDRVAAGAIAVAGPVTAGKAAFLNVPWETDCEELAAVLGTPRVELMNDLVATAYGIRELDSDRLFTINAGERGDGPVVVIAAGTGLGEAVLVGTGAGEVALASEGGHADFGPADEDEAALLGYLRARHGHVSWERVVSGPGLQAIYLFLAERAAVAPLPEAGPGAQNAAAAIAAAAIAGADPLASRALDWFVGCYGAEAGNLALKVLATGGVFVAGGIAPKILDRLRGGAFMARFCAKGRHAQLMTRIPVQVVLEPKTALIGAARRALRLAGASG